MFRNIIVETTSSARSSLDNVKVDDNSIKSKPIYIQPRSEPIVAALSTANDKIDFRQLDSNYYSREYVEEI